MTLFSSSGRCLVGSLRAHAHRNKLSANTKPPTNRQIDQLRVFNFTCNYTSCLKKIKLFCIAKMDGWNNPPET